MRKCNMIDLKVIIDKYPESITNSRLMKSLLTDYYPGSEYKSRINILDYSK